MRWRPGIRTVLVYALLGAGATVLTSWGIHAVQFRRASGAANPPSISVPNVVWPIDRRVARRAGIDTTIRSGQTGIDTNSEYWKMILGDAVIGHRRAPIDPRTNADAAWRRHRRNNDRLASLPDYPFPYRLFEVWPTRTGWRILASRTHLLEDLRWRNLESTDETLLLIRSGWPLPAMEAGAHYAQETELHPSALDASVWGPMHARVEEVAHPPTVSLAGGVELWAAPRPPIATGNPSPIDHSPLDRFALPLLPLWPGFLINTLFYALLLFALIRTPRVLRRALRRRGGRCDRCGYDRAGLDAGAACPECGMPAAVATGTGAAL